MVIVRLPTCIFKEAVMTNLVELGGKIDKPFAPSEKRNCMTENTGPYGLLPNLKILIT